MSSGCSREPTVRQLKATVLQLQALLIRREYELVEAHRRIDALDSFARRAGGVICNIAVSYSLVPEKAELLPLAEEWTKLFPSDQSMEF